MHNSTTTSHSYQSQSRGQDDVTAADAVFGRTVVPVPNRNKEPKKDKLGFEYAEHCFIGDAITLNVYDRDGKYHSVAASDYKLQLRNGLQLTYGQVNGLAGDFYGTYQPISDGVDDNDRQMRFAEAYATLADPSPRQPQEATAILAVLQAEVDAINEALKNHEDPSVVYAKLPDVSVQLEELTIGRTDIPGYLGLSQINWDHFGADARTAYIAGHAVALSIASVPHGWIDAYVLNAFADHFLEDSFSAGHLRTPRRQLHKSVDITADACAKFMHDEDNAIGLIVQNPAGDTWNIYGDKRALDQVDADNLKRCVAAVQASADEVWTAFLTGVAPDPSEYKALAFLPTLGSARGTQALATLFTFELGRRQDITQRREWQFTTNWWFWSTALDCKLSGWWNYPITIDGPKPALTFTAIASTVVSADNVHLYYQDPSGGVTKTEYVDGAWQSAQKDGPLFVAAKWTPLSVVQWDGGKHMHVYSISTDYKLQEHRYSSKDGEWIEGSLGELKIEVKPNSSLAACQWADHDGQVSVRVYYQDPITAAIQELCGTWNDNHKMSWASGAQLPVALPRSSISATAAFVKGAGVEIRVCYQDDDLYLKEHCYTDASPEWSAGPFNPGQVPGCSPCSIISSVNSDKVVASQAYWRLLSAELVRAELDLDSNEWQPSATVHSAAPGMQFSVASWEVDGAAKMRVYYQSPDGSIAELSSEDGQKWSDGEVIVRAKTVASRGSEPEGASVARTPRSCIIA